MRRGHLDIRVEAHLRKGRCLGREIMKQRYLGVLLQNGSKYNVKLIELLKS